MRLFLISVVSLLFVGFILVTARIWGLSQIYPTYDHPLLKSSDLVFGASVTSSSELERLQKLKAGSWAVLPVRISADKKIFILNPTQDDRFLNAMLEKQKENPTTPILKGSKLNTYTFDELQSFYGSLVLLSDYYSQYPDQIFMLNLIDNISEFHAYLKQMLDTNKAKERTVIISDTHVLLTATKEQLPELVFGSSLSDITRLLSLDSLGIISATPEKFDVLTTQLKFKGRPLLTNAVVSEMKRRNKKVFVTQLNSEDVSLAKSLEVNGYFFSSVEEYEKNLSEFSAP